MKFTYHTEADGQIHLTKKHGISTALVEASFPLLMREWNDGNAKVRLCKSPSKRVLKVVYRWKIVNKHAHIITAHYYP
jgi:hypothetical protein